MYIKNFWKYINYLLANDNNNNSNYNNNSNNNNNDNNKTAIVYMPCYLLASKAKVSPTYRKIIAKLQLLVSFTV